MRWNLEERQMILTLIQSLVDFSNSLILSILKKVFAQEINCRNSTGRKNNEPDQMVMREIIKPVLSCLGRPFQCKG
ncbi:hypothetical protein D3C80_1162010 [compost metagenome]